MSSDDEVVVKKRKRISLESDTEDEFDNNSRMIQFKYDKQIHMIPVTLNLKVNFICKDEDTDKVETNLNNDQENGHLNSTVNGKSKGRSKAGKGQRKSRSAKEVAKAGPEIKAPEAVFRFITKIKEEDYKEPSDAIGTYQRHIDTIREDDDLLVEYDMDEEDVVWLNTMNSRRKTERQLEVDADTFELLMDRFERESLFHQSDSLMPPIDEDAVCCICNDGECQNSNAIIFCDMCNLAVHQECYGVPYVPEGQWLCRRCMQSPSVAVSCVLCPNKGGAFKQTDDNRWAHVTCALWIPEVCFGNTVFLEPVENIHAISGPRWNLVCSICRQKKVGACIQCEKVSCCTAFHVTCASQAGLYMKIEAVKKSTSQGVVSTIRKVVYCPTHCPRKKGKANGGIYSSGDDEDSKTQDDTKMQEARKILAENRSFVPIVSIPQIPPERLSNISKLLNFPRRNDFLLRLYAYWKLKREAKNGAPLVRRRTSNQNQVYRSQKKDSVPPRERSEIQEEIQEVQTLRIGFEMLRNLLEIVKKRERIKFQERKEDRISSVLRFYSLQQFLTSILDRIVEKDTNRFFLEPVSVEDAPDYYEHVSEPMDLGTMRTKIETFKYTTFEQFRHDLNRVVNNCLFYNDKDTIFHKAALKLRPQIDNILKDYQKHVDDFDLETGLLKDSPPV